MNETYRHSVSVAGIIENRNREVLVIRRRDNDDWYPPGGIVEAHETFEEALIREIKEEMNVLIRPVRLTGVYKNMSLGIVALVFLCRYISGDPTPTLEAREVCWIAAGEIPGIMREAFAIRVSDALQAGTTNPVVRIHDGTHLISR